MLKAHTLEWACFGCVVRGLARRCWGTFLLCLDRSFLHLISDLLIACIGALLRLLFICFRLLSCFLMPIKEYARPYIMKVDRKYQLALNYYLKIIGVCQWVYRRQADQIRIQSNLN